MGIVVTVLMALGLLLSKPFSSIKCNAFGRNHKNVNWVGITLFLAGVWNAFWYGLQHLGSFWGMAALISGVLMIFSSLLILSQSNNSSFVGKKLVNTVARKLSSISIIISFGLLLSFLLYFITLIQLNLGMPILG
jgi:hypothetical protein